MCKCWSYWSVQASTLCLNYCGVFGGKVFICLEYTLLSKCIVLWCVEELTAFHRTGGYLDVKPHYSNDKIDRTHEEEIYLSVSPGPGKVIQICGMIAESHKYSIFRMEYNVKLTDRAAYTPDVSKRKIIELGKGRHQEPAECMQLDNVPPGEHVLGITGDPAHHGKSSSVSHIISW